MKLIKLLSAIIFLLSLTSCFKEDTPITPKDRSGSNIVQIEMDRNYSIQSYFDLFSNSLVDSNKLSDWDLGFECSDGFHIVLNHAKLMSVSVVKDKTFEEVTDTVGKKFTFEGPEGNLDNTAIGKWWQEPIATSTKSLNYIYIVNRGANERSRQQGLRKLQVLGFEGNRYIVRVSNLDNSNNDTILVEKNPNKNFNTVILDANPRIVEIEPDSKKWQLHFTRYTQFFSVEGFEIYSVVGVFINTKYVSAVVDSSGLVYENVKLADVVNYKFSRDRNSIGYEWKSFKFDEESYTINTKKIYLLEVRDLFPDTRYFKLRFTDFYKNINGKLEKGYPKFEYEQL